MFNFKNENAAIYKKGILIIRYIMVTCIILTLIFDDTLYKSIFRGLLYSTCILLCTIVGTKEVIAKKNKSGFFYYFLIIVLILVLILTRQ